MQSMSAIIKDMTNTLLTKSIFIICGLLLFFATFNLPIGYYTFLRISVLIGALLVIKSHKNKKVLFWQILFGLIAILFNPFFPIYLYIKNVWIFIDLACGLLFLIQAFTLKKISKTI